MLKLTKALAASVIVAGAVFAAPLAANAAPAYPAPTNAPAAPGASSTVAPGGQFSVPFPDHSFIANHLVEATFISAGPVPQPATFLAATSTLTTTSTNTGAATFTGTLPAGAVGVITIQATDGVNNHSATITVAAGGALSASDPSLATTGTYISLATVWGAVGLVAVGAGFITIRTMARRKKATAGAHTA